MPAVLTAASSVQCSHLGKLTITPSTDLLRVDGQSVVVGADLLAATITGCGFLQAPCTRVTSVGGLSTTLRVGGQAVAVAGSSGRTNSGTWQVVSAGQTKLEAA